jgi:DMSO/TMAO reductase YedYZ molybdopterin-dependent catalytic subunit
MTTRFRSINVRIHSRRTFLRTTGAAFTGLALGACKPEVVDSPQESGSEIDPISSTEEFYVVWFMGSAGDVVLDEWTCAIQREGNTLAELDWEFMAALQAEEKEHTLQCIESRPGLERMNNAIWTGLPLSQVLEAAGVEIEGGNYIRFACADGYSMALPITDLETPIWLAWTMNGEPLTPDHGFPVRVLIPGRFGWLNPKQVIEIDFIDNPYALPWLETLLAWLEAQDMTMDLDERSMVYQVQTLVVDPHDIYLVDEGKKVEILGKAYAGSDPVVSVELSMDGGSSWAAAELTYAPGADRWTLWRFEWTPEEAGIYMVELRCTTQSGAQTDPDAPLNHIPWSGGMTVEVEVV